MRLSSEETSDNFWVHRYPDLSRITLDGEIVYDAVEADDEEGWVVLCDAPPRYVDGVLNTKKKFGLVKFIGA